MTKPVATIGDLDSVHCSLPVRGEGTTSVFINGRGCSTLSYNNTVHLKPSGNTCVPHQSPIVVGSDRVFISGLPAGGIGADVGGGDCTTVVQGSNSVLAG